MASWSFLTNHGLVLTLIGHYPDSTGLEIAQAVGITERAARKIVADLLSESYIEREKVGRRNRYSLNTYLPLRHPAERAATVGELLELLWREKNPQAVSQVETLTAQADIHGTSDKIRRARLQPREARRTIRA
jgi:DNA-binding MarR family transcriptional regulator